MPNGKERFTAQEVADAVYEAKGLVLIAARRLETSPKTVRNYARKYAIVKDAIAEAREDLKDFVESKMLTAIEGGDTTMMIFYAKTQMKDRGYIERKEFRHDIDVTKLSDEQLAAIAAGEGGG
ncbi:MAG: hypothetical protein ACOYD4_06945 [Solirubrobacterales bacterium]